MKLTITGSKWEIEQWILTTARGLNAGQPLTAGTEYKRPQKPLSEYVRDLEGMVLGITEYHVTTGTERATFYTLKEAREYAKEILDDSASIDAWTYFNDGVRVIEEETPDGVKRMEDHDEQNDMQYSYLAEVLKKIPFITGKSHKTYAFQGV